MILFCNCYQEVNERTVVFKEPNIENWLNCFKKIGSLKSCYFR